MREIHRWLWISRTKGLYRGKCFRLMTSSSYQTSVVQKVFYCCALPDNRSTTTRHSKSGANHCPACNFISYMWWETAIIAKSWSLPSDFISYVLWKNGYNRKENMLQRALIMFYQAISKHSPRHDEHPNLRPRFLFSFVPWANIAWVVMIKCNNYDA